MDANSLQALEEFLARTPLPDIPRQRTTLFDITGKPHYENRISDFYAFFFSSEEDHGLGTLFLEALLDVLDVLPAAPEKRLTEADRVRYRNRTVQAMREEPVAGGRLDLIVHTGSRQGAYEADGVLILIENKVWHHAEGNDFNAYADAIHPPTDCRRYHTILGLEATDKPGWPGITHRNFAQAVQARLGAHLLTANPHYLPYLTDFLENINRLSVNPTAMPAGASLYFSQLAQFQAAVRVANVMSDWLPKMFQAAFERASLEHTQYTCRESSKGYISFGFGPAASNPRYVVRFGDLYSPPTNPQGDTFQVALWYGREGRPNAIQENERLCTALRACLAGINVIGEPHQFTNHVDKENEIIHKTYAASLLKAGDPVEVIAKIIRDDWQPLEPCWTPDVLAGYGQPG